jgi:hypothetical protein
MHKHFGPFITEFVFGEYIFPKNYVYRCQLKYFVERKAQLTCKLQVHKTAAITYLCRKVFKIDMQNNCSLKLLINASSQTNS